ncbi:MAG: EamA family transporter [Desulfuromonadales bacterium]|nr:EamA family transporter [Desulfuromonadales bacterium]
MSVLDILAALAVALIWGLNIAVIKVGVAEFPPIFMTGMRFLIVAVLLIWWVRPPWEQMRLIVLLSFVTGGLHFGGVFFGLKGVDVSIAAILILLGVPFSVLFARILLKERFGWKKICGMAVAFVGLLILLGAPETTSNPLHLIVFIAAIIAWGLGNTIIKMIGRINIFALNAWIGLFASVQLLLVSMFLETGQLAALQNASLTAWGALAYIVLMATITGYGLWYYLVGKHDVTKVVPFNLLVPVIGVLSGVLLMGDELKLAQMTGGFVTLIGVAIIQLRWRVRSKTSELPARSGV